MGCRNSKGSGAGLDSLASKLREKLLRFAFVPRYLGSLLSGSKKFLTTDANGNLLLNPICSKFPDMQVCSH